MAETRVRIPVAVLTDAPESRGVSAFSGGWLTAWLTRRTATEPFVNSTVRARALAAWKLENERRVKEAADPESVELLRPITLHEARHSAASYLIEAGLNDLELTSMIGLDTYFEASVGGA